MKRIFQGLLVTSLVMTVQAASAATLTTPNVFVAGTPASASEVNANFAAAKTAVDSNDSAIGANTTAIGANTTAVGANATAIGANTTAVGANATAIGANTTAVGANTTAIGANTTATGTNSTAITSIESRLAALESAGGGTTPTPVSLASVAGTWGMIYSKSYAINQNSNFVEVAHETLYGVVALTANGTFSFSVTGGKDAVAGLTVTSSQFTDPSNGFTSTIFDQGAQLTDTVATSGVIAIGNVTVGQNNAITLGLLDPVSNVSLGFVDGFVSQNGQMMVLEGHDEPNANMVWTLIKTQ